MTPLVRCTLWYMAGLIVPFYIAPDVAEVLRAPWVPTAAMFFAPVALAVVWRVNASKFRRVPAIVFALLGVVAGGVARNRTEADCRARMPHNAHVLFAGQPASLPGTDGGFALQLVSAEGGGIRGCTGIVRAKLPASFDRRFVTGAPIAGTATWMTFPGMSRLPLTPDRRGVLLIQHMAAAPASVPTSHILAMRTHAQLVLRATLRESGLAEALVLAQREGVDKSVNDAFTSTGMSHLLSISGTHVGLVAALLLGFAAFLRLGGNAGRIGATAGVIAYVGFLGAPAAAARSAIQVLLLLSGRMLQRPSDPYAVLAAAALWLLVQQPLNLLDAGFQLSFAGVIGLIAYRGRIAARLPRWMPSWLRDGIAASLAASGVTIPIAAIQFGTVAPIGVPASIIAVPLVGLALPAVALVLGLSGVSAHAARFFGSGADLLLDGVAWVAKVAAEVPGGHAPLSAGSLLYMLALAAGVVLWWAWSRERAASSARAARDAPSAPVAADAHARPGVRWRIAVVASTVVALAAWSTSLMAMYDRGDVEIHAIDVGQGDAIAIRTPHSHWILIDAGPRDRKFDAGRSRVLPYLLKRGAHHLDALILSHPHADHIGGAASVLAVLGATAIIDPATAVHESQYFQTMHAAHASSTHWYKGRDGRHLDVDGVRVDFLYPASDSLDGAADANDLSVAVRITYGEFSALFMGDAPVSIEERLVAEYGPRIASDVLKVGHHGSHTSSGDAFLDVVHPTVALISVGRDNRYGHPDPDIVARLLLHRIRVMRTDEHGAVVVSGRRNGRLTVATQR